jgi:hypothetical protein
MLGALFFAVLFGGLAALIVTRTRQVVRISRTFGQLLSSGKPEDLRKAGLLFATIVVAAVIVLNFGAIGLLVVLLMMLGAAYAVKLARQQNQPHQGQGLSSTHVHQPLGRRFNPAPGWPVTPGWSPPPQWTPPMSWAAAPPGWQFWVPAE